MTPCALEFDHALQGMALTNETTNARQKDLEVEGNGQDDNNDRKCGKRILNRRHRQAPAAHLCYSIIGVGTQSKIIPHYMSTHTHTHVSPSTAEMSLSISRTERQS